MKAIAIAWAVLALLLGLTVFLAPNTVTLAGIVPAAIVARVAAVADARWAGAVVALAGAGLCALVAIVLVMAFGAPHGIGINSLGMAIVGTLAEILGLASLVVGAIRLFGRPHGAVPART